MSFTFQEPIAARYRTFVPTSLRIDQTTFAEARIIRLLTGTLDFTSTYDNFAVKQRRNLTNALGNANRIVTAKTLRSCLAPISQPALDTYLIGAGQTNRRFHENLLTEYCFFFQHCALKNHTSAFVHLYRILEFISYTFPLMHASMNRNYYSTYDALRSYFSGKDSGELKFLQLFTNKLFHGDPLLLTTADCNIVAQDGTLRTKVYSAFKRLFSADQSIICDDATMRVSIPYGRMIDAIVTLRNKYFHFATGGHQQNIASVDIGHPNTFFENFNIQGATWLSIIYFELLKHLSAP